MAYKTVMSIDMDCYKCKRVALHSVTKIDGIDTVSINTKEKTLTVVGDADPVCIANQIRRKFKCARLVSTGPPPPPPKPEEKEKKDDENKKKDDDKKDDGKKDEVKHQIVICPKYPPCMGYCSCAPPKHCGCSTFSSEASILWPGWHPPKPPANEITYFWTEENPSSCIIC